MIRFALPGALALLALLVPLAWWWWRASRRPPALLYPDAELLEEVAPTWRVRLAFLPRALRVTFLVLAALAIAGPESGLRSQEITRTGVDIVTILDRSSSMRAMDLEPDRMAVARRTIARFVEGRESDRVGLVAFARRAYTACPLTLDHGALTRLLGAVEIASREEDGTAIGLGLAAAITRLRASDAESRVAVLVTDGVNNAGEIDPLTAADLAADSGIRVYTIGVGSRGRAPILVEDRRGRLVRTQVPVEIDERTLEAIAERTGGRYFRATDEAGLEEIFATIDELEKSEFEETVYVSWSSRFEPLLLAAGLALFAELLLGGLVLRRLP